MEICPICGTEYDDICLSCLSLHSKCVLCFQHFDQDEEIIHCKECDYLGHAQPMEEWLQNKGYCPICKIEYNDDLFERINLGEGLLSGFVSQKIERYRERLKIFDEFSFRLPFYEFQSAIIYDMDQKLMEEDSYLFISPPGSGKTIIGLAMANKLGRNTLVLTPNLAVLGSWLDRAEMFFEPQDSKLKANQVMSKEEGDLRPITILTYQKLNSALRNREENWIVSEKMKKGMKNKKNQAFEERDYLIDRLIHHNIGLIVLDEAHRLTKTWGDNVLELIGELDGVKIIGLTATPPDDNNGGVYDQIFSGYTKSIPLPLLIREGILVPYQDLGVILPSMDTLKQLTIGIINNFISNNPGYTGPRDAQLDRKNDDPAEMIGRITKAWDIIETKRQIKRKERLYLEGYKEILYLNSREDDDRKPYFEWLSANNTVKMALTLDILYQEYKDMGDQTRVLILLEQENLPSGYSLRYRGIKGAIGVFQQLVMDQITDELDPVLVTGKSLLVDDDFTPHFLEEGKKWAKCHQLEISFSSRTQYVKKFYNKKYCVISGFGKDWNTDTYTRYVTYLFDKGITKCLVGTKFLLGEGWDSLSLNTVIDLTTFYSSAAVKQAKGRALRRDPNFGGKASNLWEIIPNPQLTSLATQELERFEKRHSTYFGIDNKGNIRNKMDRIIPNYWREFHRGFYSVRSHSFKRSKNRKKAFKLWKVGQKLGDLYYVFRFSLEIKRTLRSLYQQIAEAFDRIFTILSETPVHEWYSDYDFIPDGIIDHLTIKVYTSVDQDQQLIERLDSHFSSPNWNQGYATEITYRPSFLSLRKLLSRFIDIDTETETITLLVPSPEPVVDPQIIKQQVDEKKTMKNLTLLQDYGNVKIYHYFSEHGMIYPQFQNVQREYIENFTLEHEYIDN